MKLLHSAVGSQEVGEDSCLQKQGNRLKVNWCTLTNRNLFYRCGYRPTVLGNSCTTT